MKPVAFLLLIACLQRSTTAYCQQPPNKVTLSEKNASLEKVLTAISQQTGLNFGGTGDWTSLAHPVTIFVKEVTFQEALKMVFRGQPLSYEIVEGQISIHINSKKELVVKGIIRNEKQEPVPGATIFSRGMGKRSSAITDESGNFAIMLSREDTSLVFSGVSYESKEVLYKGESEMTIHVKTRIIELEGAIIAHTGYQDVAKDRATGSFSQLNLALINRPVTTNVMDRLDGVTSSLIFNKNIVPGTNPSTITIRGRSTINGNPEPLTVVDNFPYGGDVRNINPEDIETITVLKDAAAASIWGAFSGNGVIVMTTKKGKYKQAKRWNFTTSLTVGDKPDLYYQPIMSSKDYIDVEEFLFSKNYFDAKLNSPSHPALSPVAEILYKQKNGLISGADAQAQINMLRNTDTRSDLDKYFYQHSISQLYALNFSGGSKNDHYYVSAGLNKDVSTLVRNQYNRITLNGSNTWSIIPKKFEVITDLTFATSRTQNNNSGAVNGPYPYLKLKDGSGNASSVPWVLRQTYVDTAGGGQLLDWHYRPLDELHNANDATRVYDYRANIGLKYTIVKDLSAHIYYQYQNGRSDEKNLQSIQTYAVRNLINSYTQVDGSNPSFPIPRGGIMDQQINRYRAHNIRTQLNYDHSFGFDHQLNALAGWELRDIEGQVDVTRLYGYDPATKQGDSVDYMQYYPLYYTPTDARIPYQDLHYGTSDRFISYYANASYIYKQRYIVSGSARRDESNLFGVRANQKGVPLWSAGLAWEISRENFYQVDWLPLLKLRVTNGANGNVDRGVSAYTTAQFNGLVNDYTATVGSIINPPNPSLRWEKINIFNAGLDFATRNHRVEGSVEYYIKSGKDLIGKTVMDPTTGVPDFTGNTANMVVHGFDLTLHTRNLTGALEWNSDWLLSYGRDKVTRYAVTQPSVDAYFKAGQVNPLVGRPLYSVYGLRWLGLDPTTGDPRGSGMNGHADTTYSKFITYPLDSLMYKGPATPSFFGSWRNSFSWKQFEVSFNIIFKLGYSFRRNSIQYFELYSGISGGSSDYDRRWQKPGDEKVTNVPSRPYPAYLSRDQFYAYSEVLVEKGDHIRLQDIKLNYDLPKKVYEKLHVQAMRFYLYANNIGILWRANHYGIDPDAINIIPNPRTLALGCKLEF